MDSTMDGMPRLIQAGMGIHVSSARLANEAARLGALGVVSAVGLRHWVIEEVRAGDETAIALARRFPVAADVAALLAYAPGGAHHRAPVPLDHPDPIRGRLPQRLSIIAAFVEASRAKLGHQGKVGINVMWKCPLTVLPSIYGAMLAGVDALLCGAGVPMELPTIVAGLRAGENLAFGALHGTGTPVSLEIAGDHTAALLAQRPAPKLMPILSNVALPKRIVDVWQRELGGARPDAFILENHEAGGHNAPPRNKQSFSEKDGIDAYFDAVRALGVPIYVAGAFPGGGSRADYLAWRERGAYGIQVGSRFALADESGMRRDLKDTVLAHNAANPDDSLRTETALSPTGYPFKVVPLPGTVALSEVRAARKRICNKGYLMSGATRPRPDGSTELVYRCPAMPVSQFVKLGGDPDEAADRVCLCNALFSTVGFDSEREPALVTLGRSGTQRMERATARDVVEEILTPEAVAAAERALACTSRW
jgi:NAD(P)H-dependent flavin oxidoreductase YrpB (nitropropane dioxygenase family)